ncbi:MAG: hypothetical protein A3B74_03305 [Candidatus Kerfeldbacteria bacterium RIFCSPHIGHO2_02_FULL_42_14]|uniref:Chromosomal replication initiator protein DnaA n=1 Tax=Candidatus Kerfeldbacteria bacterium RIFCSPHIGHO2_02_FULL_42_14 TaxID=1798540 RepID=A0A1G2APH6_9BACT|nr:MAG: hypothetical protein A3B74_03305 [Candidatus Kerfeldbacteria bacterium RIFCSPHIGHO2_02_FULL_42_14]OGY80935.1 MAG: hypothetical protein A3E60_03215 [Candidatus Kerfeldbacteria bacterium RIFCSPHIGHO2_12_FULL_42_13]OGY84169.1 MAG: hypothetical protein A3I91_01620 [Candidatus Kerfeldbacteria bacterium RIFCSPLOWO2_02_FULL_42_19]OGY87300.1 MAG: hypothetical protein A3G01_03095 [Candidatus Kerfeldbacteria bacterium RIFCSPLOWO2_12_FULL_43_9]
MNKDQLWHTALGAIELSLSKAKFITWFRNTRIIELSDEQVIIGVPNIFTKTWLENKYHHYILEALSSSLERPLQKIVYKVIPESEIKKQAYAPSITPAQSHSLSAAHFALQQEVKIQTPYQHSLNPKYIFKTFVVGKKNELAHAACQAVAHQPGTVYNPLFIYGDVGLGKTHLMQAVGNQILLQTAHKKVLYVTSETFTNEFISAVQEGKAHHFKNKYRSIDVLLIDDIQFMAGKEGTQEAFFHTFNHLHQINKQIVITSDRPPKSITALGTRLLSRFEWGMIVDISAPDLETRIAILQEKCKEKSIAITPDVLQYIASHIQNNIRELEGALNRIVAHKDLHHIEPTLENIKDILSTLIQPPKRGAITKKDILEIVAEFFHVKMGDLVGNSRKKELVVPRQIAMFLMREEIKTSFPSIGEELGGRDHTTAMYAHTKIKKNIEDDQKLQDNVELIKERIYNKVPVHAM